MGGDAHDSLMVLVQPDPASAAPAPLSAADALVRGRVAGRTWAWWVRCGALAITCAYLLVYHTSGAEGDAYTRYDAGVAAAGAHGRALGTVTPLPDESCAAWLQAKYNCTESACAEKKVGFINYLYFHECTMEHMKGLSFVVLSIGFLFLLYLLEDTTDHYFCVAIKRAVQAIGLSPEVAGVTFLSVGNGASDVFSSIAAFAGGAPKIGIGTLVGAALFVATVVVGAVALVTGGVQMRRGPFVRETTFLALAVLYVMLASCRYLFYCMHDATVSLLEIGGFFILYGLFVCAVVGVKIYHDKHPEAAAAAAKEDANTGTAQERALRSGTPAKVYGTQVAAGRTSGRGVRPPAAAKPSSGRTRTSARRVAAPSGGSDVLAVGDHAVTVGAVSSGDVSDATSLANAATFSPGSLRSTTASTLGAAGAGGAGAGAAGVVANGGEEGTRRASPTDTLGTESVDGRSSRYGGRQRSQSGVTQGSRPYRPVVLGPDGAPLSPALSREASRVLPDGSSTRPRFFSDSSVRILQLVHRPPPPMLFNKANRFTSSFLDVLGVNPFPDAPRKAVASAMARFTSADAAAAAPLLGNRRPRPFSTAPGADPSSNGRSYGYGMQDSNNAIVGLLHHSGPDVTAQDYIDMYTSGASRGAAPSAKPVAGKRPPVDSAATVASTVSQAAATSTRMCSNWLLKLREFLYPIMRVLNWPIKVARNVSIPRVEEDCWDWRYAAASPFFGLPLTGYVIFQSTVMQDIGGGVPVLALVAAVGALASVILCIILPRKTPPEGAMRLSLVCFAFLTSIVWILVIANELVGIAATFGTVSGMSDSMVGLTILSIGNSVNDMAADVTIARAGFPSMAIAGAYAGPMFNILFGLGVPLLIETTKHGTLTLGNDSLTVNFSLLCAAGFVVFSLCTVALSGFRVTRLVGACLLALYTIFFGVLVYFQTQPGTN